jgi:hypothetical protein
VSDEIRRQVRREIARLRLGTDEPVGCALCGETEPAVLRRASRRLVEFHHLPGHANDPELGVFLCRTHHDLCTELMRLGIPLSHVEERVSLERLEAVLRGQAIFFRLAAPLLDDWADRVEALTKALDREYPGWRDLEESR